MDDELKPCPFCGSNDIYIYRKYTSRTRCYITYAHCELCGASSKAHKYESDDKEINWDDVGCRKAIDSWNRRAKD